MSNPLGIFQNAGERVVSDDINHFQDRLFWLRQQALAYLYASSRYSLAGQTSSITADKPQSGVAYGLQVAAAAGLAVTVTDGEALIEDTTATGEDAPYRLARLDTGGVGTTLTLAAAPGTVGQSRIDLVSISPATVNNLDDDTRWVETGSGSNTVRQTTSVHKRIRASANLVVTTGTAAVNPTAPAVPTGAIVLAYVRVANGDTTPDLISDSRTWLLPSPGNDSHGLLVGGALAYVSATQLQVQPGRLIIGGEVVKLTSAYTFTVSQKLGSGVNLTGPGFRYVYAYRRHRNSTLTNPFEVVVSTVAPSADGTPSSNALPGDAIAASLASWDAPMLFVGSFYLDGTNTIMPWKRVGPNVIWSQGVQTLQVGSVDQTCASSSVSTSAVTPITPTLPGHSKTGLFSLLCQIGALADYGAANDKISASAYCASDTGLNHVVARAVAIRINTGTPGSVLDGFANETTEFFQCPAEDGTHVAIQVKVQGASSATAADAQAVLYQVGYVEDLAHPVLA